MKQIAILGAFAMTCSALLYGCTDKRISYAQESVKSLLSDPASAQFNGDRVIERKAGKYTVCGSVNAKNRMGGYVGFRYYIFDGMEAQMLTKENASDFAGKYLELCSDKSL